MKKVLAGGLLVGVVAFGLGPRVRLHDGWLEPTLADVMVGSDSLDAVALEAYVGAGERAVWGVRAGDEAGIRWLDPDVPGRTPLAIVYLHGFSADRHEVDPLLDIVADSIGANVYFARLRGHGRSGVDMGNVVAEEWLSDAAEAFAVGGRLGERVVVVGTSTGGTLAAWLAARPEVEGRLAALVLLSPNFHPADRASRLLLWPWGGTLARIVVGPERCFIPVSEQQERHWTTCYPPSALLPMMALVEHVRTMDLSGIEVPTLALYVPDDRVVDAAETEAALARMPPDRLSVVPFPDTEDPGRHVVAGDVLSPGTTRAVARLVIDFLRSTE